MGTVNKGFSNDYEIYMKNFLFRLLRHDFVVSYIDDFFNQNEKTYYSFFMLMKILGIHTDLKFQTNFWSDCYIYFYEILGVHGILFIPLLLSKGTTEDKKKVVKKYLNEHINHTKGRLLPNSNLVMNLIDFKKVILTYFSCISTRALENFIKVKDEQYKKEYIEDIQYYKRIYSNICVENFVDMLLRPYSRQNFFVNVGKFIDDNIDFLTDDKKIRKRLKDFHLKQKELDENIRMKMALFKQQAKSKEKTDDLNNIFGKRLDPPPEKGERMQVFFSENDNIDNEDKSDSSVNKKKEEKTGEINTDTKENPLTNSGGVFSKGNIGRGSVKKGGMLENSEREEEIKSIAADSKFTIGENDWEMKSDNTNKKLPESSVDNNLKSKIHFATVKKLTNRIKNISEPNINFTPHDEIDNRKSFPNHIKK